MRTSQNSIECVVHHHKRRNPGDKKSMQLRCDICDSVYHMVQSCPEKSRTCYKQEVVLYLSDFDHNEQLKTLVCGSWNAVFLDIVATNIVAGESWFNCHMSSLSENKKQNVQYHAVHNKYRFDKGKLFPTLQIVDIQVNV